MFRSNRSCRKCLFGHVLLNSNDEALLRVVWLQVRNASSSFTNDPRWTKGNEPTGLWIQNFQTIKERTGTIARVIMFYAKLKDCRIDSGE